MQLLAGSPLQKHLAVAECCIVVFVSLSPECVSFLTVREEDKCFVKGKAMGGRSIRVEIGQTNYLR